MIRSRASVPMAENMSAYLGTWSAFFLADVLLGIFSYLQNIDNCQVASNEDSFNKAVLRFQGWHSSSTSVPGMQVHRIRSGIARVRRRSLRTGVFRVVFVATGAQELAAYDLAAALDNVGKPPTILDLDVAKDF